MKNNPMISDVVVRTDESGRIVGAYAMIEHGRQTRMTELENLDDLVGCVDDLVKRTGAAIKGGSASDLLAIVIGGHGGRLAACTLGELV